jgi:hypothetical protein
MTEARRTPPRENIPPVVIKRLSRFTGVYLRGSATPSAGVIAGASPAAPAPTPAPSSDAATPTRTLLDPVRFSTPHDGAAQNADGSYRLATIQGVNVDLLPDDRDPARERLTAGTELTPQYVGARWVADGHGRASSVTPPSLNLTLQTHYGPDANPDSPSGYGRGTTDDDKRSDATMTLGFHEGTHGTAAQQYLRDHPLPVFQGRQGMTVTELQTLGEQHKAAVAEYVRQMTEEVRRQGDCVGHAAGFCSADGQPGASGTPSPSPAPMRSPSPAAQ